MRKNIRKQIFKKVKDFYGSKEHAEFIPGKTVIPYGGRVYDEKELINAVDACLDFWLTEGRFVKEFNSKLASFIGVKYCIPVNSGSSANLLAVSTLTSPLLKERRLMPGDEIITTACGFPTTLNPVIQNNLVPVFIDVELGTYNIQAKNIEKAITKKTKAIFTAHTLGNPIDINTVKKIVKKYKLWWIEDNCDSLGSKYEGKFTGSFGDISTCSFYPPHHITMGEGGALLTNNQLLRKIIMSLRDWGRDCRCETGQDNACGRRFTQKFGDLPFGYDHKYVYSHIGYNLKITDMQAAIGCAQLEKLPEFIRLRKRNFVYLYERLKEYDKYLYLPKWDKDSEPSWFGLPLLVGESAPFARADIVSYLERNKVATRMLFGGNLTKQPAYKDVKYRVSGKLKNTDLIMNNLFWVGVYPGIKKEELNFMAELFKSFFGRK